MKRVLSFAAVRPAVLIAAVLLPGPAAAASACLWSGLSYSEGAQLTLASSCGAPMSGGGGRSCKVVVCRNGAWTSGGICIKGGPALSPCPPDAP